MAIYHLTTSNVSRGQGKDSTAASAYRAGDIIRDERTGNVYDYRSRRPYIMEQGIIMPPGCSWTPTRQELWNSVETKNIRVDARTAREYEAALPFELTDIQRVDLAMDFGRELVARYGVGADVAIHRPNPRHNGDERNYHVHVLLTTDAIGIDGTIGNKNRQMNKKEELQDIRKLWEDMTNEALHRAGHDVTIDCRTLVEQGIFDREAMRHEGVAVTAMERKGIATIYRTENEASAKIYNLEYELANIDVEISMIDKEIEELGLESEVDAEIEISNLIAEAMEMDLEAQAYQWEAAQQESEARAQAARDERLATIAKERSAAEAEIKRLEAEARAAKAARQAAAKAEVERREAAAKAKAEAEARAAEEAEAVADAPPASEVKLTAEQYLALRIGEIQIFYEKYDAKAEEWDAHFRSKKPRVFTQARREWEEKGTQLAAELKVYCDEIGQDFLTFAKYYEDKMIPELVRRQTAEFCRAEAEKDLARAKEQGIISEQQNTATVATPKPTQAAENAKQAADNEARRALGRRGITNGTIYYQKVGNNYDGSIVSATRHAYIFMAQGRSDAAYVLWRQNFPEGANREIDENLKNKEVRIGFSVNNDGKAINVKIKKGDVGGGQSISRGGGSIVD